MMKARWMLVSAAALTGLLGSTANASGLRISVGAGWSHGSSCTTSCSWEGHSIAGRLCIDGCTTLIRADCDFREEVVRAFRRAGYQAFCQNGEVVVRFGCRRPDLRWFGQGYGTRYRWEHGCVRISFFESACHSCSDHRQPGWGHRDTGRDVCPPPHRPHRPVVRRVGRGRCG